MKLKFARRGYIIVLVVMLLLVLSAPVQATTIKDVTAAGMLRIGNDVYDPASSGLTALNVIKSINNAGNSTTYVQFSGRWYDPVTLAVASDLFKTDKAVTTKTKYTWPMRKWYQAGTTMDYFGPVIISTTGGSTVTLSANSGGIDWVIDSTTIDPIGSYSFTFDKEIKSGTEGLALISVNGVAPTTDQQELITRMIFHSTSSDMKSFGGSFDNLSGADIKNIMSSVYEFDLSSPLTLVFQVNENPNLADHTNAAVSLINLVIN